MLTNYYCKCDKCGVTVKFNNRPFEEILTAVKKVDWVITKNKHGWRHYCPTCWSEYLTRRRAAATKTSDKSDRAAVRYWWQKD